MFTPHRILGKVNDKMDGTRSTHKEDTCEGLQNLGTLEGESVMSPESRVQMGMIIFKTDLKGTDCEDVN
jgi:hypothetical protein